MSDEPNPPIEPQDADDSQESAETPTPEPHEEEEEQALGEDARGRAANEALRSLARASRSYLIYDARNDAIRVFLEAVKKDFEAFFDSFGDMELEVRPFELVLEGETVYLERDRERSLSFKLFRDGVRRITIQAGVPWDELTQLLGVVSVRYVGIRQNPAEDDIVTLLWKAGFSKITVEAVEGFVPEEEEGAQATGAASQLPKGAQGLRPEVEARIPKDFDLPAPKFTSKVMPRFRYLREEAQEKLLSEDTSSRLPDMVISLTEELLAVVRKPSDPMSFDDVSAYIGEAQAFMYAEGEVENLLALAQAISHHLQVTDMDDRDRRRMLHGFSSAKGLRKVVKKLDAEQEVLPAEVAAYLSFVGDAALAGLLELLAEAGQAFSEIDRQSGRKIMRRLVERYLPDQQEQVIKALKGAGGTLAADLLRVLAAKAPEAAAKELVGVVQEGQADVQLEFLSLVAEDDSIGGSHLRSLLVALLRSEIEDVRVRAIQVVAGRKERGSFEPLKRQALSVAKGDGGPAELRALGRAMATVDSVRAMEAFEEWAPKGGIMAWFKGSVGPIGWAAVEGLDALELPECEKPLKVFGKRDEGPIGDLARKALHRHRMRSGDKS